MMKTLIIFLVLTSSTAFAHDEWTDTDTNFQLAFTAATIIDWRQTMDIAVHGHEKNIILGNRPNNAAINTYFTSVIIGHYLISQILSAENRRDWQVAGITLELSVDIINHQLGAKFSF